MQAINLRKGMFVRLNGAIHEVVETFHGTPGNLRAFVQLTTKDVLTGKILNNKYGVTDDVEDVFMVSKTIQFMYKDGDGYHFMDLADYHSFACSEDMIGNNKFYLVENMELSGLFHDDQIVKIEIPRQVVFEVTEAAPAIKGNSVSNNNKPVTLSTGLVIQVPMFINVGDKLKIDTQEGKYLSRE
jgi:elongation factor P